MGRIYKYSEQQYERVIQPMPEFRDVAGNLLKEGDRVFYAAGSRTDNLNEGTIIKIQDFEEGSSTFNESTDRWEYRINVYPEYLMIKMQRSGSKKIWNNCIKA